MEGEETGEGVGTVAFHGAEHSVEAFLCAYVSGFGVEFISVTYQFFLKRLRGHVAVWKREVLADYVFDGKSGSCMPFTHECMSWQVFRLKYLASFYPVADVWQVSGAKYIRCIASEDADVMKHCRRGNEVSVNFDAPAVYAFQSLVPYFDAVDHERFVKRCAGLVIFLDNVKRFCH